MKRAPRFEVVRTAAGYHARFRAANGEPVWSTEVYGRKRQALRAIELVTGLVTRRAFTYTTTVGAASVSASGVTDYSPVALVEVREVDEREAS